jgi:hypothetical protein
MVTYRISMIKWAVFVEGTGLPTEDAMQQIEGEGYWELGSPETCEKIEMARHFIFDEMAIHFKEWGYSTLEAAIRAYISRFHASTKTKDAMINCVLTAFRRKGD